MNLPHIEFGANKDGLNFVSVESTELFDHIEDHLTETCGLEYEAVSTSSEGPVPIYTMIFSRGVSTSDIKSALSQLSAAELQQIFSINNA